MATTKHQKAAKDAKRGKLFAKLIKNIEVAARTGGGDPDGNPTLFDAIQKAKKSSVRPRTSTVRSSAGREPRPAGWNYQSITYEGYGPNGVAVMIECLTDNRNGRRPTCGWPSPATGGRWPTRAAWRTCSAGKGVVLVPGSRAARRSARTT